MPSHLALGPWKAVLLSRKHHFQTRVLGLIDHDVLAQRPLPFLRLAGKNVARKSVVAHDLAGARPLEALRRATMCFQFWHETAPPLVTTNPTSRNLLRGAGLLPAPGFPGPG